MKSLQQLRVDSVCPLWGHARRRLARRERLELNAGNNAALTSRFVQLISTTTTKVAIASRFCRDH
jgi:hypothetical protein